MHHPRIVLRVCATISVLLTVLVVWAPVPAPARVQREALTVEDIRAMKPVRTPRPLPVATPRPLPVVQAVAAPKAADAPKPTAALTPAPVPSVTGIKAYALSRFPDYGWGPDQFASLDALWTRESKWNPRAVNGSSGACGIPQRHPCKGLSSQPPEAQVDWGLSYIKDRKGYGSPAAAWGHFQRKGWY